MASSADDDFLKGIAEIDFGDEEDAPKSKKRDDKKPVRVPPAAKESRHKVKREKSQRTSRFDPTKQRQQEDDSQIFGRYPLWLRKTFWVAGSLSVVFFLWAGGLIWFAETMPSAVEDDTTKVDAIVVLTGGSGRLQAGFDLLAKNLAQKVFVSGVYRGVDVHELFRLSKQTSDDKVECCVILGYDAENTHENALEAAAWLAKENYQSLRLVTANYHMRRSLFEFRQVIPRAHIIENPVFPENYKQQEWWKFPGSFSLAAREYTKYLGVISGAWANDFGDFIIDLFGGGENETG